MKLRNMLALPLAFAADVATLGNIGSERGSFTQQLIDHDAHERALDQLRKLVREAKR